MTSFTIRPLRRRNKPAPLVWQCNLSHNADEIFDDFKTFLMVTELFAAAQLLTVFRNSLDCTSCTNHTDRSGISSIKDLLKIRVRTYRKIISMNNDTVYKNHFKFFVRFESRRQSSVGEKPFAQIKGQSQRSKTRSLAMHGLRKIIIIHSIQIYFKDTFTSSPKSHVDVANSHALGKNWYIIWFIVHCL